MKTFLVTAITLALGAALPGFAQSLDDLNIQIHGYATQAFLYTNQNNIFTTDSASGSPAWTEVVLNVGGQPKPQLRVAVQARYFLLGNYGNSITLDWAQADYKVNDKLGLRFGKVKTPSGLLNDVQDIDPAYMWSLLPQSVYPIASRNSLLAQYGGVVYGAINLGQSDFGKLEYRGWGGERVLSSDDGYFLPYKESGIGVTDGLHWIIYGAALHWKTPLTGLMVGSSYIQNQAASAQITAANGALPGTLTAKWLNTPSYFARYERGKWMVAGESARFGADALFLLTGLPGEPAASDLRQLYGMASYKVISKLSAGAYYSQVFDHKVPLGPARYSKDWVVSGRYDFNEFLYAKAEEHFIKGTYGDFDAGLNPNGLKPSTDLTILKIGVYF